VIGQGARQRRCANGKPIFQWLLKWRTTKIGQRFQTSVLDMIRSDYPGLIAAGPRPPSLSPRRRGCPNGRGTIMGPLPTSRLPQPGPFPCA
jgi:hypothetical protein